MKVPFTTQKPLHNPNVLKLFSNDSVQNTTPHIHTNEPKPVLDLRRSPSPVANKPAGVVSQSGDDPSLQWVEHELSNNGNTQDWESLMREYLGLHDDSTPEFKPIPQFHPYSDSQFPSLPDSQLFDQTCFAPSELNFNLSGLSSNPIFNQSLDLYNEFGGFDFVDDLILQAAECLDSNQLQSGQVILARLNEQFRSPVGNPHQRASFYFVEALQSLLTGSTTRSSSSSSSSSELVQTIKAYKMFSNISPIVMFSNFTANQAILEAVDCSVLVHVIDFDIGLGGHWASFMREVSERSDSRRVLRISAVVPEDYVFESRLIRDNLSQFARELNIGFEIDFVLTRTFQFLSFKAFKVVEGEKTAVLLSPAIFRQIGAGFLSDLRLISANVVVYVDGEGLLDDRTSSFPRSVIDGREFYSTVLESLEAAAASVAGCGGEDWIRRIETFVLRPKIIAAVEAAAVGRRGTPWRDALAGAGMRQVALSQFADFQAECLLRRLQIRGFHVAKRHGEMVLCWHERPLISTSAWR